MDEARPGGATGEHQPERDAVESAHGADSDDSLEEPVARPFTPVAPFGDAKPWAGSTLEPGDEDQRRDGPSEGAAPDEP